MHYVTLVDPFTSRSMETGGFAEYIVDTVGYSKYLAVILLISYILLLFLIVSALNRITCILPVGFIGYLVYLGYPSKSFISAIILVMMIVYRVCRHSNRARDQEVHRRVGDMYLYPPSKTSKFFSGGISLPSLLLIIFLISMCLAPEEYAIQLRCIAPIMLVLLGSSSVPGVGGHSTMGMLCLLILALMGLMVSPQVMAAITDTLIHSIRPKSPPIIDPAQVLQAAVAEGWSLPSWWPTTSSPGGFMRIMIGSSFQWWLCLDDFSGPSFTLFENTKTRVRDPGSVQRRSAGIYNSKWVTSSIFTIIMYYVLGWWSALISNMLSFCLVFVAWRYIGASVWEGWGQSLANTNSRQDMVMVIGGGPTGLRKLILIVSLMVSMVICLSQGHLNWIFMGFILICAVSYDETSSLFVLGLLTLNTSLVWYAIRVPDPVNADLRKSQIPAYSPSVGYNSSEGYNPPSLNVATPPSPPTIEPAVPTAFEPG